MNYPQENIKPYGSEGRKAPQVERMFDNIAHKYDLLITCSPWALINTGDAKP
jgi:demethylmenaquinone methyltransferase/2-methoxy-6-polyprenyl-1,4-benzoquinol methylase